MNGELPISKETYVNAADEAHFRGMQYDLWATVVAQCDTCRTDFNKRITKLENRKKFDTTVSGAAGVAGGFLAVLVKRILGL